MYGVVLFAAMASAGPSCHCQAGPAYCCPVSCGCCGEVRFFWSATSYAGAVVSRGRQASGTPTSRRCGSPSARTCWTCGSKADEAGRQKMIAQVRSMQPADKEREPDREVRAPHRREQSGGVASPVTHCVRTPHDAAGDRLRPRRSFLRPKSRTGAGLAAERPKRHRVVLPELRSHIRVAAKRTPAIA